MKQIIPFIFILTLLSCINSEQAKETSVSESAEITQDTILVKIKNELDNSYQIGFYSKSYTYCWAIGQDTLDFKIGVTEYVQDSSIRISAFYKNPILFTTVLNKINDCLPLIKEDFEIEKLRSLYFSRPPIFYKDLTTALSKDYESQFGQEIISYKKLDEFLMNSWLEEQIGAFLVQFGKTTRRYGIEKFHLLEKEYYKEYIPSADLKEYPEFSIHGMGISVNINKE
jgi:hypothetical protein